MITAVILYFMQSAICMAFFYALYWLFLKKDTFFRINRIFLLLTILASILIPTLEIPFQPEPENSIETPYHVLDAMVKTSQEFLSGNMLEEVVVVASVKKTINWYQLVGLVYFLGILVFSFRFFKNLHQLSEWSRKGNILNENGNRLVLLTDDYPPFSFLNTIFISQEDYQQANFKSIIEHEKVHVNQYHTFDLLFIEVLSVIFWLNPFVWFYKSSIKEVHEYLADDKVVKGAVNVHEYKMHIVNQFAGADLFQLANNFGESTLKKRIFMLGKMKSPKIALVKFFLLVPVFLILLSAFAFTIEEKEKIDADFSFRELWPVEMNPFSSYKNSPIDFYDRELNHKNMNSKTDGIANLEYKKTDHPNEIKVLIDEMPEYPGGLPALQKYIASNMYYPVEAQRKGIEGRVFVSFVVSKKGLVKNAHLVKSFNPLLDKEALRVVESLPKWKPGRQNGKLTNIAYTIPVNFLLGNQIEEPVSSTEPLYAGIKNASDYHLENTIKLAGTSKEYTIVEKMPQFTGNNGNLRSYISRQIKYPVLASEQGYEGKVFVEFIVGTDGIVKKAKVIKGANVELNREALRVINRMPTWIPGEEKGAKVEVKYTVPIRFSLQ